MNQIRKNDQRARLTIIVFWIFLGTSTLFAISSFLQYQLLQNIGNYSQEQLEMNDLRHGGIAILHLIVFITLAVVFIQWFRRAYFNLHQTEEFSLKYTEGWAAGAWFVPFLNLVRPYEIMAEIWEKTQVVDSDTEGWDNSSKEKEGKQLVGWWWALFLLQNIANNIASRIGGDMNSIEGLMASTQAEMFVFFLEVPAILVAINVVKKVSKFEEAFYEKYAEKDITESLVDEF
jgi:hypothetical protein